jgi:threonine dehydrogenase-like Zn-dependent dehydrogenase
VPRAGQISCERGSGYDGPIRADPHTVGRRDARGNPEQPSEDLVPSLLMLSDVIATGWHAAVSAEVKPDMTVAVAGDGAVGLCGVLAACETHRWHWRGRLEVPMADTFWRNVGVHGGPASVRHYLPELVDRVWSRGIEPGKAFDLTLPLQDVAEGYRAMDERRAIKVLLEP